MGRLASIQALRIIKALARLGWTVDRVSGSHHILTMAGLPPVTIPVKKGATLKEGDRQAASEEWPRPRNPLEKYRSRRGTVAELYQQDAATDRQLVLPFDGK